MNSSPPGKLRQKFRSSLDNFRHKLAYYDAMPQLLILGILSGILSAFLIVLFRLAAETPLFFVLGDSNAFETLPPAARFLFPFTGAIVLGFALHYVNPAYRQVSVSHVLDRLHNHEGKLPRQNIIVQFFGGIITQLSGQSVGREGPAIHIGAGVSSLMGQWLRLPNNSMRTLVACGAAAGISASFNTPMAGVIFSMEVILMEYTIIGFIPVIIASVLGTVISQMVFGQFTALSAGELEMNLLWELPYLVLAGLVFALVAACFIRFYMFFFRLRNHSIRLRFLAIGLVTGLVAIGVPEVLGSGYDTLNGAIDGDLEVQLLLLIVVAKLLVAAVAAGLGMLGGLIGPTLVIGGCLGGVIGIVGNMMVPTSSTPDFYTVVGMVALMGAVLNAPLAALVAILELSNSPAIIFPSMLVVVVSSVTVRQVFKCRGIFMEQLHSLGHGINYKAGRQFLSRIGVRSVMETSFVSSGRHIKPDRAQTLLDTGVLWIVIEEASQDLRLLSMSNLAKYLDRDGKSTEDDTIDEIDLMEIPGRRYALAPIPPEASLYQASVLIQQTEADALYVERSGGLLNSRVVGIITRETIMSHYGIKSEM
ncbi:MAG: chloride channel protein [Pseudohongiellaceae bacterium]